MTFPRAAGGNLAQEFARIRRRRRYHDRHSPRDVELPTTCPESAHRCFMSRPAPAPNVSQRTGIVCHPLWQLLAGLVAGASAWVFITSASFPQVDPAGIVQPAAGQPPEVGGGASDAAADPPAAAESAAGAEDEDSSTFASPAAAPEATTDSDSVEEVSSAVACQPPQEESSNTASEVSPETEAEQPSAGESADDAGTDPVLDDPPAEEPGGGAADASAESADQSTTAAGAEVADDEPSEEERAQGEAMMRDAMGAMGAGAAAMGPPPPLTPEQIEARRVASIKNAALSIGFLGALLCGLFGLVEGISRRSLIAPLAGLLLGLFIGAAGGGLAGGAGMSLYHVQFDDLLGDYLDRNPNIDELRPILQGMLVYAAMWSIVGVAGGLSMSLLSRRPGTMLRSVTGAVIGGVLGGVLYATLEAWAFPLVRDGLVIPRGVQNGLLWALLPTGLIGLLGCWQGRVLPRSEAAIRIRGAAKTA